MQFVILIIVIIIILTYDAGPAGFVVYVLSSVEEEVVLYAW